jgi:hypothetical protein
VTVALKAITNTGHQLTTFLTRHRLTMPRIHDPFTPSSVGPGSAVGIRSIAKRSRRGKSVSPRPTPKARGDEEGKSLDFCSQDVEVWPDSRRTVQGPTGRIPGVQVDHEQSRPGGSHLESGTKGASMPHQPIVIPQPCFKSKHRHALAVDTRYLDEPEGERAARAVLKECFSFLTSLVERGVAPSILASTELREPASTKKTARAIRLVMGTRSVTLNESILSQIEAGRPDKWLSLVPVRPAINLGNTENQQVVYLPKALLAHSSWKMLGDMGKKDTNWQPCIC